MAKRVKETIKPPAKRALTDASRLLSKASHPAGGRVMADKSVAVREGVTPGKEEAATLKLPQNRSEMIALAGISIPPYA